MVKKTLLSSRWKDKYVEGQFFEQKWVNSHER